MIKLVEFKNRKNKVLRGVINIPENKEKVPVVINLHGFKGNKSGYSFVNVKMARKLEEQGIGCARFDFYGSGESDGDFSEMTFTSEVEDAMDIYEYVQSLEFVDKENIFLSGQSMGGFVAATVAPKLEVKGLILMCPGASMSYGAKEKYEDFKQKGLSIVDIEGTAFNIEFYNDLAKYSPFEDAKGYKNNVLLLWGTNDKLVDEATCNKYVEVYEGRCEFVKIEGGDHNFAKLEWHDLLFKHMIDFIKNNL